jgi:hypothetical protein
MAPRFDAAGEQPVIQAQPLAFDPGGYRSARLLGHFELNRPPRLPLDDYDAPLHAAAREQIRNLQPHEVAAAELAIECQVEQHQVANGVRHLQADADAPHLKRLERELRASWLRAT